MADRFDRHYPFFGKEGQKKLGSMRIAVVGAGGTGSHVIQQLAYLGVGGIAPIDKDELDDTSFNRHVTADHDDPVPGSPKVDVAARLVRRANPGVEVHPVPTTFLSEEGFQAVVGADAVFGCVDNDGVRLVLNELCCAYERPIFDVASGITPEGDYGGRVCVVLDENGCLYCQDLLDKEEIDAFLSTDAQREARRGAYDMPPELLGDSGPSVVSINGVVASLAVTEFMLWATGIRAPKKVTVYRGNRGIVNVRGDDDPLPWKGCYYCTSVRGKGDAADVQRYIKRKGTTS